jgi:hypothetical protein
VTRESDPAMRARISEFLGLEPGFSRPTALFVTIGDEHGVVIHPSPESWDLKEESERFERLKWAAETLPQVAERCSELEIGCVFENKLPHLLFARTSDLLWILASMASVEVGVCLDNRSREFEWRYAHCDSKIEWTPTDGARARQSRGEAMSI